LKKGVDRCGAISYSTTVELMLGEDPIGLLEEIIIFDLKSNIFTVLYHYLLFWLGCVNRQYKI